MTSTRYPNAYVSPYDETSCARLARPVLFNISSEAAIVGSVWKCACARKLVGTKSNCLRSNLSKSKLCSGTMLLEPYSWLLPLPVYSYSYAIRSLAPDGCLL